MFWKAIEDNRIIFCLGPAGCGKTLLAMQKAYDYWDFSDWEIILTRPTVTVEQEEMGFLPGKMRDKFGPFMEPMTQYTARVSDSKAKEKSFKAAIQAKPLAFMQGLSFAKSFVILDEAQNTTVKQMHMLLTRIGSDTKMVIIGDVKQCYLDTSNGLADAVQRLKGIPKVAIVEMTSVSVLRDPLVKIINERYS